MKQNRSLFGLCFAIGLLGHSGVISAADLMVNGEGSAPITADIALTRESSLLAAKRDAVISAIKKINGAYAHDDEKVRGAVDDIAKQVGAEYIFDQSTRRDAANNFVTTLKLKLDDQEFRKLISDHGIAVKTANNYPILVVMDEYFTTPTDTQKPLREVVEYFSDKSAHNKIDASANADMAYSASESESSRSSAAGSSAGSRSSSVSASGSGYYGSGAVDASGSARKKTQKEISTPIVGQFRKNETDTSNIKNNLFIHIIPLVLLRLFVFES